MRRTSLEELLDFLHAETPEQVSDGVIGGEAFQPEQRVYHAIPAQPFTVSEAPGACQYGHEKRRERAAWIDALGDRQHTGMYWRTLPMKSTFRR
jgi:hypothetical protein